MYDTTNRRSGTVGGKTNKKVGDAATKKSETSDNRGLGIMFKPTIRLNFRFFSLRHCPSPSNCDIMYNMLKKTAAAVLLLLLVLVSCQRNEFTIRSIEIQPYVLRDGHMGLSVFAMTEDDISIEVTDPSGDLTWRPQTTQTVFNGSPYRGSADMIMPLGVPLPKGQWLLKLIRKDGRVIEQTFDISYREPQEDFAAPGMTIYDGGTNLTWLY